MNLSLKPCVHRVLVKEIKKKINSHLKIMVGRKTQTPKLKINTACHYSNFTTTRNNVCPYK